MRDDDLVDTTRRNLRDTLALLEKGNQAYMRGEARRVSSRPPGVEAVPPLAGVLCCSELGSDVEELFGCAPGEFFVMQNLGCVVTATTTASAVFAAGALGVRLFVVLGHTGCAGAPVGRFASSTEVVRSHPRTTSEGTRSEGVVARADALRLDLARFPRAAVVAAWHNSESREVRFL